MSNSLERRWLADGELRCPLWLTLPRRHSCRTGGLEILTHLEEVDYLEMAQEPGCLVFLDFSKAYDHLDRNWVVRGSCMPLALVPVLSGGFVSCITWSVVESDTTAGSRLLFRFRPDFRTGSLPRCFTWRRLNRLLPTCDSRDRAPFERSLCQMFHHLTSRPMTHLCTLGTEMMLSPL